MLLLFFQMDEWNSVMKNLKNRIINSWDVLLGRKDVCKPCSEYHSLIDWRFRSVLHGQYGDNKELYCVEGVHPIHRAVFDLELTKNELGQAVLRASTTQYYVEEWFNVSFADAVAAAVAYLESNGRLFCSPDVILLDQKFVISQHNEKSNKNMNVDFFEDNGDNQSQ